MNKSIVEVKNIGAEDLFSWFYDSVIAHGGDGVGAICCQNYREVFEAFKCWALHNNAKYINSGLYKTTTLIDSIILHDNNENYIFTNNTKLTLFEGDYIFIVRQDCPPWNKNYPVIKSIEE